MMRMPVAVAVGLEVALDRDHHEIVLRVPEDAAQRFGDAHHFVGAAFDLDELADGIAPFEEAVRRSLPMKATGACRRTSS